MSKDALPYFKWYPADADTDEDFRAMSDAEIGFYLRTLNHTWRNAGISSDPRERARILKVSPALHDRMWARVGRKFQVSPSDQSRLVNPRQEEERAKAISRSESAAASVRTRYVKPTNVDKTKEERKPDELPRALARAESESEYESESESGFVSSFPNGKTTEAVTVRESDGWDNYLGVFLAAGKALSDADIQDALRNWISMDMAEQILAFQHIQLVARRNDPEWIPFPVNHLRKKPWTRRGPGRLLPEPRKQSRAEIGQAKAAAEFLAESPPAE